MSDLTTGSGESETPVNPYSLLEAVNHSSDTAHTGWLIFLAIMAYLMIAVAGVTHKDLLLETPVSLPILQVNIQLAQFFQFAPIVLVLMHLGIVSQLTLLARETLEFDNAIRLLEATDKRTHPLRLELNNFFFVQAIAGPNRSRVMSALPARHELADAGRAARRAAASISRSCSYPIITSPSPGRTASPFSSTSPF